MLHRSIHATTLFLNPSFSYKCAFDFVGNVMEGLHSCIQRMVPDPELRSKINREILLIGTVLAYLALMMLLGKGPSSCHVSDKSSIIRISIYL